MDFIYEYGSFLLKSVTVIISFAACIAIASSGKRRNEKGELKVTSLSDHYLDLGAAVKSAIGVKTKKEKKKDKEGNVFVVDFSGDVKASQVSSLREELSAILHVASPSDEVVVKVDSGGGYVHSYGLASAQLERVKSRGVPLTVCIDSVAASGGYMMACVADKIVSSPFAVVGSIGVVAQVPNFHRLLKKNDIDFEILTAGEHKRTLTMLGENTDEAREKFSDDLVDTHSLFKEFISDHRPMVDIDKVSDGDVWYGCRAMDNNLVDVLLTSDEYILEKIKESNVFKVEYQKNKSLAQKVGAISGAASSAVIDRLTSRFNRNF